ncbi:hypothetical protein KY335_01875 [Candidatus Woesearchaeota archaeon]|nr:hypothetical protein [Candidatus Woesearchaeota archaeon]
MATTIKKGKGVIRRIRTEPKFLRKPYKAGSIEANTGQIVPFITMGPFEKGDKVAFETSADGMVRKMKKL